MYDMKFLKQKLVGIGMLIMSAILLWMFSTDREDCGVVFITIPLGLILLFGRKIWIV